MEAYAGGKDGPSPEDARPAPTRASSPPSPSGIRPTPRTWFTRSCSATSSPPTSATFTKIWSLRCSPPRATGYFTTRGPRIRPIITKSTSCSRAARSSTPSKSNPPATRLTPRSTPSAKSFPPPSTNAISFTPKTSPKTAKPCFSPRIWCRLCDALRFATRGGG